jgi:two-component system response regulator (stage 0 sporulation protein F)
MSDSMKILIVDDQPGVRYLLDIVIKEAGHQVYTAQNGREAVEIAKSSHPDLIFMDVRMPLMGGLEALSEIKAIIPETDVIIMTAYGSEETVTRAMEGGALCCIAKPFDVEKIKELLEDLEWKHTRYKKALARDYA